MNRDTCSACLHFSECMERRGKCKEYKDLEEVKRDIEMLNKTARATKRTNAEKLYKRGMPYVDIAEKLGLSRTQTETVLAILRKENRIGRRNAWVARRR